MMFEVRDDDFVAGLDALAKTCGEQIDRFGRAAREYDLASRRRVNKVPDFLAGALIRFGCAMTERVYAAMNVRMVVFIIVTDGIGNASRCPLISCARIGKS